MSMLPNSLKSVIQPGIGCKQYGSMFSNAVNVVSVKCLLGNFPFVSLQVIICYLKLQDRTMVIKPGS